MTGKTVREFALEHPAATRIFERLGIDYCCGGDHTLEEACESANLAIEQVLRSLEAAASPVGDVDQDWAVEPLSVLIAHIQGAHHVYAREEIEQLPQLLEKVCSAHGTKHPELGEIRETFANLADELRMHMMKEEMVLFPHVLRMEQAAELDTEITPPPFGTVRNPVAMMLHEHDDAGAALRRMRAASNAFTLPEDACTSVRTLYRRLAAFEADLHQHIHLENNILFPRAIALEQA
jgi:regulator of cell morphogenesis and NO signaling